MSNAPFLRPFPTLQILKGYVDGSEFASIMHGTQLPEEPSGGGGSDMVHTTSPLPGEPPGACEWLVSIQESGGSCNELGRTMQGK